MKLTNILSIFSISAISLIASPVIDQNQSDNNTYMAGFSQGDLAQSFKQSGTNISGAGILLQGGIGSTDTVTISLWDNLPTNAGAMLATGSVQGTAGSWADVFWSPLSINAGSTYYLVFSGNSSLGISGSTSNPYADGMVFANSGFGEFGGFDYTFRTYSDDQQTSSVPDANATLPAVMAAFVGLVAFKSRRRA